MLSSPQVCDQCQISILNEDGTCRSCNIIQPPRASPSPPTKLPLKRRMSLETPKAALLEHQRRRKIRRENQLDRIQRHRSDGCVYDYSPSTPILSRNDIHRNVSQTSTTTPMTSTTTVVHPRSHDDDDDDDDDESKASSEKAKQSNKEEKLPNENTNDDDDDDAMSSSSTQYSSVRAQKNSRHLQGKYEITNYLGHGSYGHVYKATNLETNEVVAIKRIVGIFENLTNTKRLLRELRMLRYLDHDNIIEFHEIIAPIDINSFRDLWIVFEFVETDLHKLINHPQHFTNLHVQFWLYQILLACNFMHTAQIIHRDIKPANLLVNSNCTLKICDFGLARGIFMGTGADHPFYNDDDNNNSSSSSSSSSDDDDDDDDGNYYVKNGEIDPSIYKKIDPALVAATRASMSSSSSTSNNLVNMNEGRIPPPPLRRRLTQHVVTRWYRAPELILCSKSYTAAIDMWSIGCVFAELLTILRPNVDDRRPVFPGTSCYPLSNDKPLPYQAHSDQLNVIFEVIGTPTNEEISEYPEKTQRFLRGLPKHKRNIQGKFSECDKQAVDLLEHLLQFDPKKRYTCKQCIEHPYLSDVSDKEMEKSIVSPPIHFDFEDVDISSDELRAPQTNPLVPLLPESPRVTTDTSAEIKKI